MFNTLKYAKKLEEVGVVRKQAETYIQIIAEIIEVDVATKEDLRQLGTHLDAEIKDLKNDMAKLEYRMTIKLGTIVTVALAAMATIIKFF